MKPRIILFDIEVSRDVVAGYGKKWDFKVVKMVRPQELMCYAYKELNSSKVHYVSRNQFDSYKEFVQSLHDLLDSADIVIAHNGNGFDIRMANRFFIKEGLGPVSPYRSIDTLQIARSQFKFFSNSLNDLGEYLELGSKKNITYADLEDDFMSNPTPKIERLMAQYNKQDVVLLEKVYNRFLPYIRNHPNMGDLLQLNMVCPKCGSANLIYEGTHARRTGRVASYSCKDCKGWCNSNTVKRPNGRLVNS